ncbi:hypothetical protein TNCV_4072221 [Trichonephila clavipes]|uniref:Uncharacterized protein n=1 Tax=Trichonephila clavipes TaxID=2585209 RepID=A0A8X6W8M9_TRICX|nr:hypothetical protein TNCV_4072221 [Trichonephila clavipes]
MCHSIFTGTSDYNQMEAQRIMHVLYLDIEYYALNSLIQCGFSTCHPFCKMLHILPCQFETFKSSWMLLAGDDRKSFEELKVQLCMFERNFINVEDSSKTEPRKP